MSRGWKKRVRAEGPSRPGRESFEEAARFCDQGNCARASCRIVPSGRTASRPGCEAIVQEPLAQLPVGAIWQTRLPNRAGAVPPSCFIPGFHAPLSPPRKGSTVLSLSRRGREPGPVPADMQKGASLRHHSLSSRTRGAELRAIVQQAVGQRRTGLRSSAMTRITRHVVDASTLRLRLRFRGRRGARRSSSTSSSSSSEVRASQRLARSRCRMSMLRTTTTASTAAASMAT